MEQRRTSIAPAEFWTIAVGAAIGVALIVVMGFTREASYGWKFFWLALTVFEAWGAWSAWRSRRKARLFAEAQQMLQMGWYERGIAKAQEATLALGNSAADRTRKRALALLLAEAYRMQGQWAESLEWVRKIDALDENGVKESIISLQAKVSQAELFIAQHNLKQARTLAESLLRGPLDGKAKILLGRIYAEEGSLEKALAWMRSAAKSAGPLEADANKVKSKEARAAEAGVEALQHLGRLLILGGRAEEAKGSLEKATSLLAQRYGNDHPCVAEPLALLSEAQLWAGQIQDAAGSAQRAHDMALSVEPMPIETVQTSLGNLSLALAAMDRMDDACRRFTEQVMWTEQATKLGRQEDQCQLLCAKANLAMAHQDWREAHELLDRAWQVAKKQRGEDSVEHLLLWRKRLDLANRLGFSDEARFWRQKIARARLALVWEEGELHPEEA